MTMRPSFYSKNKKRVFSQNHYYSLEEPVKVNIGFNVIILFSSFNKLF